MKGLHEHMKRIHSVNTMKRKCADDPQPSTSTEEISIGQHGQKLTASNAQSTRCM